MGSTGKQINKMQTLFKDISESDIFKNLEKSFTHPAIVLFRERELREINKYNNSYPLSKDNRILDLGCGEGYIGNMLLNKIDVGLDISPDEAAKAKDLPSYKNVTVADIKNLPFKNVTFNVIFSNSVIEHIKGIENILNEAARVLKDTGIFIFTVPSHKFSDYLYFSSIFRKTGLSIFGLDKLYIKARNAQLNHFNLFDDAKWQQLLDKSSLKITYKRYYLSYNDIYEWDKMSILLRITKRIPFLHRHLEEKFHKKVISLLSKEEKLSLGAGLLIVAEKTINSRER